MSVSGEMRVTSSVRKEGTKRNPQCSCSITIEIPYGVWNEAHKITSIVRQEDGSPKFEYANLEDFKEELHYHIEKALL